ncbi:MAG: hypothetical protein NT075_06665 [Chloroflexi bacterium]|nr:hypothetical protein [Chloroflexota bacterium]
MREIFAELVQAFVGSLQVANLAVLIFAITFHHVLHYRQQHHNLVGKKPLPASTSDPRDDAKARTFFSAFQQFSPDVQQILLLYYLYGISLPEIAQISGRSERSLAKTLYHAKMYLQ